jgi:thiosulfate/3-mercaptopyruvate sulfurtransferase
MNDSNAKGWTTLVDVPTLAAHVHDLDLCLVDARFTAAALAPGGDPDAGLKAWRAAHLPGSVYAHLNRDLSDLSVAGHGRHPLPDPAAFARWLGGQGIGPDTQVVVYDAADGAMAAARLWWLLKLIGHERVAVLDGGLAAWQAAGLDVTADTPSVSALPPYPGTFDMAGVVSADEVLARLADAPGWLLDARNGERFRGEVEPIDPVAGHVPGAINRPLGLNLRDGRFRPPTELKAELAPLLHGRAPAEAVVMCGSGVTACHLLLALEVAGLHGARVYADSWSGWLTEPARPVATGA